MDSRIELLNKLIETARKNMGILKEYKTGDKHIDECMDYYNRGARNAYRGRIITYNNLIRAIKAEHHTDGNINNNQTT